MIYTHAVFRTTAPEYSHVCPKPLQQLNLFNWFNFMKVCRPSSVQSASQNKTNSSSCQVFPPSQQILLLEISESKKKNTFCGSNVRQLKRVERGLFCTTDMLWETLRVLVCCLAHVLEMAFPPRVWQWLSGWAAIFSVIRLNGKAPVVWIWPNVRQTSFPQPLFFCI